MAIEFLGEEPAVTVHRPKHRRNSYRPSQRLLGAGVIAAWLLAAALRDAPSLRNAPGPPAPVGARLLPGTHTPIEADRGKVRYGSHEFAEMLCRYKKLPDGTGIPETVPTATSFALQLAHPAVRNFAIVYTGYGVGQEIVAWQHFDVQQKGQQVRITSSDPPISSHEQPLSKATEVHEGESVAGKSGMIDYRVARLGGQLMVGLACDREGTDAMMRQAHPYDTIDPGWQPPQPVIKSLFDPGDVFLLQPQP